MFSLGWGEMAVIAIVALVVVGPERLPHAMRQAGRWYGQLRRTADDLRRAFVLEADRQDAAQRYRDLQERRRVAQEARKRAQAETGGAPQPSPAEALAPAPPDGPATDGEGTSVSPEDAVASAVMAELEQIAPNDIDPNAPHPRLKAGGR